MLWLRSLFLLLPFPVLDSGFLRGFLTLFRVPTVPAGMIFPEAFLGMTILKNKQHPVARMHLDMMNAVLRMNRSQNGGNQLFQNILGDLLRSAVCLTTVIERAADPDRRGIGRAQSRNLVPIFLSADTAVNAVGQRNCFSAIVPRWWYRRLYCRCAQLSVSR